MLPCIRLRSIIIIHVIFVCNVITSKKLTSPGLSGKSSKIKLNECDRCKVLTDSFSHWLLKTSRGKYDGGDAAWEESKLKSYSRSEIRLVEIQEGLCSELTEHQDDCYTLSEETEQILEKWWFHNSTGAVDLYSWLCINTLKNCCPISHFGENCTPCPVDNDNKICSGHGKCDGDGTREGNGTCKCKRGYTGIYCKECATSFFLDNDGSCEACHRACNGCSGEGASACHACKPGWQLESNVCVDVDECLSPTSCKSNQICINKEGSFKCTDCDASCATCVDAGDKHCKSCDDLKVLWNSMCITKEQHRGIVMSAVKRLALYIFIMIILIIVSYRSIKSGAIIFLVYAVVIGYLESMTNSNNTLIVLKHLYLNL